jgi:hypothetical protein
MKKSAFWMMALVVSGLVACVNAETAEVEETVVDTTVIVEETVDTTMVEETVVEEVIAE